MKPELRRKKEEGGEREEERNDERERERERERGREGENMSVFLMNGNTKRKEILTQGGWK